MATASVWSVAFLVSTAAAGAQMLTDLRAAWCLDEGAGQAVHDVSGNGNHGQLGGVAGPDPNDPVWIGAGPGTGLAFDGGSPSVGGDYVRIANSSTLEPSTITVQAWVRAIAPHVWGYIVAKGRDGGCNFASYGLYTGGSGGLLFYVHTTGLFVASPDAGIGVWDGQWHCVTGTYDGSFVRLYVDAVPVGAGTPCTGGIGYGLSGDDLHLGAHLDNCAVVAGFAGDIAEVSIWGHALSQPEVHAASACRTPPVLARATAFGAGCVGSGGMNTLSAASMPVAGTTFVANAGGMPPLGVAMAVFGFQTIAVPMTSLFLQGVAGCDLLASPDILDVVLPAGGAAQSSIALPNNPALAGQVFHHQVVAIETNAGLAFTSITSTNGLTLTIGTY